MQPTLRELLEDPVYRAWFSREPPPAVRAPLTKRQLKARPGVWVVWVQRVPDGTWARRRFFSWKKAHAFLTQHLTRFHDATLGNTARDYMPPLIAYKVRVVVKDPKTKKPKLDRQGKAVTQIETRRRLWVFPLTVDDDVRWCGYCRRPTEFRWFSRHHTFRPTDRIQEVKRCCICGVSGNFVRDWRGREFW